MILIGFTGLLAGQNSVTFQLDLGPLLKDELFSIDKGHRVFVRGSFNSWQGDIHELSRAEAGGFYSGTFVLDASIGDTLAYKYVIEKGPGRIFWEERPDPGNPDRGNRRMVLKEGD